jgi:EF-P beta-lysylation protein EpmB
MLQPIPLHPTLSWQEQLADLVTDPAELLDFLGLAAGDVGYSEAALADFPLRLTRHYLQKIRPADPFDPLLMQVLPHRDEMHQHPGYSADPLDETGARAIPGLLHKYTSRVLLVTTSACAINCRYCFRRHFPYADNLRSRDEMQEAFRYIADDPQINEVILSGGDPLVAPNRYLQWLLDALFDLPSVKRVRIHSRLPVVLPDRIDPPLLGLFAKHAGRVVMVLHANHVRELDERLAAACRDMLAHRVLLLNQSVLLKGVNDDVDTLCELSEGLFASGIHPYYLHLMDKVSGAAHFDTPESGAILLHRGMQARLPGYLVPKLVREAPGAPGKTPLL